MLLTPELAANAAIAAYDMEPLRGFPGLGQLDSDEGDYVADALLGGSGDNLVRPIMGLSGNRTLSAATFSGLTGSEGVSARSGFAFVARGAETSEWRNHLVVAIRGTATTPDILSDLNSSLSARQGLGLTHGGFSDVFDSMIDQLNRRTRNFNGYEAIHCVGHSLGGALATLLCANLLSRRKTNVFCYTFGAPRVGDLAFANWMQNKIGADRFKRVYHPGDPVPMVPVFPFFHAPHASGIRLQTGMATLISGSNHKMKVGYLPRVRGIAEWRTLENAARGRADWRIEAEAWLSGQRGLSDVIPGSTRLLGLISRAIILIVEKMAIFGLSTLITGASTFLDNLAEMLHLALRGVTILGGYVLTLIGAILRFLGLMAVTVADVTVTFLRWLLNKLRSVVIAAGTGVLNLLE